MSETPPKTEQEVETKKTEAVEEKKVASVVTTAKKTMTYKLKFPVEFDGDTFEEVPIRRCSAREISDYQDSLREFIDNGSVGMSPVPPWLVIPQEVFEAMDDDDNFDLEEASADFIPRRLLDLMQMAIQSASTSETAEAT